MFTTFVGMKAAITPALYLLSLLSLAQDFAGEDVDLYVGQQIIAAPKSEALQKYNYTMFSQKYDSLSGKLTIQEFSYSSMQGIVFTCSNVIKPPMSLGIRYILVLTSKEYSPIYYDYRTDRPWPSEIAVVGGLQPKPGYFCKHIHYHVDKFDGTKEWNMRLDDNAEVLKEQAASGTVYYMRISFSKSSLPDFGKGVIILFKDGSKINKPSAEVKPNVVGSDYHVTSFFALTKDEVAQLSNKEIDGIRCYVYDTMLTWPLRFKEMVKCIQAAQPTP